MTLIPKVDGAVEIKDFRPISMVGCLYKLISKILAGRLSKVLPDLIGDSQSAFVKQRQILDGALIANEAVWWVKKSKQKVALLKIDFQKAYDTIRWDFLKETLIGMGFGDVWTKWIMECVSTASLSILVNGSPTSSFRMQRGLRQGDPLSPFLFLLVAETFNRLVIRGKEIGLFEAVKIGDDQIPLTHLQFADDTIIFSPANEEILDNYRKLLRCFALMTGLRINYGKSVLIPLGCDEDWIEDVLTSLRCGVAKLPVTYLGIPLGADPRKSQTWKPILDKVEKRLALWKSSTLSRAGRLVLVKAVLSNLPMYYLSLFKLPKSVARRIIQLQRRFFWAKEAGSKGGCLIAWNVIQRPIDQGGLGVGNIHIRNAALLFKWWWKFADDQQPLWKKIVSSIHDKNKGKGSARGSKERDSGSIWKQLQDFSIFDKEVQDVAKKGIQLKVGNGASTRFWLDSWTGGDTLKKLFPRLFLISTQQNDFIGDMGIWENNKWVWKIIWRRRLFAWEEELVKSLYLAVDHTSLSESESDKRVWAFDISKPFSVSDFYLQVTRLSGVASNQVGHGRLAWRKVAPPRAQLLVWFILQGRLNTKERLFKFGLPGIEDNLCVFCKEEPETVDHVIFGCRCSSRLWYFCCGCWNLSLCFPKDPVSCFLSWMDAPFIKFDKKLWCSLFYVTAWSIWWLRNKIVFEKMVPSWETEKRLLLWRLGSWAKGWCPEFPFVPEQIYEELSRVRRWTDIKHKAKVAIEEH